MSDTLQIIEKLLLNGQPTFGVFDKVKQVNYLDYHSHLLSNKAVSGWRKKLSANQFCFVQIYQPPYRICVAVATLNWVTNGFCYLYNSDTNSMEVVEALQPFTRNTTFNTSTYQDSITFKSSKICIDMQFSEEGLILTIDSKIMQACANMQRGFDPLSVCTPTGKTGWTYTQKEPMLVTEGELTPHNTSGQGSKQKLAHDLKGATATLDWSLGYMRRITNWYWTCISGYLKDGRHFTINLATGVNESGASENACWVDGKRYHLPAVAFKRDKISKVIRDKDVKEQWHISNQPLNWSNVKIELTFIPVNCYKKNDRLIVVDSIFEQWLGHYTGNITLDGELVEIENMMGIAEDHYAKW